jgi:ribosome-associated protein
MVAKRAKKTSSSASKKTAKPAKKAVRKSAAKKTGASSVPVSPSKAVSGASKVASASRKAKSTPSIDSIVKVVQSALDDIKAVNVKVLDVRELTDIADTLVIASGNSDRHVRSIADRVVEFAKKAGFRPMGVEGERDGEWVLVDLQDVIVHIMLPRVREFYRLESLWDVSAARREAAGGTQ